VVTAAKINAYTALMNLSLCNLLTNKIHQCVEKFDKNPKTKKTLLIVWLLKLKPMRQEMWSFFPRLIEQKINGLLDTAEPSALKSFQLYKACKQESLWRNSYELFCVHLHDYFSVPRTDRAKSYFDKFLDRPMDRALYDNFELNFRNAKVSQEALLAVADWSCRMIQQGCSTQSVVASTDVLTKTIHDITNPPPYEKEHSIEFEDFCISWKKTVFNLFGKKYDPEMNKILKEIRWLNNKLKNPELENQKVFRPSIYLTQTEIDWTECVQKAAFDHTTLPKFPLARGPEKQKLIDLHRTVVLYQVVQNTKEPELIRHQETIRNAILEQCSWLLSECSR
jgi:hypothetical protein